MVQPELANIRTSSVPATKLTVYAANDEVIAGEKLSVFPVITPSAANVSDVSLSVTGVDGSTTSLATIDANGMLTTIGAGIVKITATAADGSGLTGSQIITIKPILASNIQVSAEGNVVEFTGPGSLPFHAVVTPGNTTNPTVAWSVTDLNGAPAKFSDITENGVLQTNAAGVLKVRAAAKDDSGIFGESVLLVKNASGGTLSLPVTADTDGKVAAVVADDDIQKMISSATGNILAIELLTSSMVKDAQLRLPLQQFGKLSKLGIKQLQVRLQLASYTIDMDLIDKALKKGSTTLDLTVKTVDRSSLSVKDRDQVGNDTLYKFGFNVDGKKTEGFGKNLKVEVNYDLKPAHDPKSIVIYYLDSSARLQAVHNGLYDAETHHYSFIPGDNF
jgi:hypothetical protein